MGAADFLEEDFGAMVRREACDSRETILLRSLSGERVGVRFCLAREARRVESALRLRGDALTAPVVGVVRGARPCFGRVDA